MTSKLYKVETRPVQVEASFGASSRVRGQMFLRPSILKASGVESIADRMNDHDTFFPLRVTDPQPATVLLSKHQVRYLVADAEDDETLVLDVEGTLAVTFAVRVELDSSEVLTGTFQAALPPSKRRALDFLNSAQGAFSSLRVGHRTYVVNRLYVRSLSEVG